MIDLRDRYKEEEYFSLRLLIMMKKLWITITNLKYLSKLCTTKARIFRKMNKINLNKDINKKRNI